MNNDQIFEKVRKTIVEQLGVEESSVKLDSSFLDDLGADSLDVVDFIMALEDEFNISIADENVEKIVTVRDAVDYISEALGE